jgi:diaminohydroxyphosphoribosylaminopyrimidine deaminase/5-amino-6-(5-phosphoribosylamino)uracil reductase
VLIGGNTLFADDPLLTARPEPTPAARQPLAAVVTSRLEGMERLRLVRQRPEETVVLSPHAAAASPAAAVLRDRGVRVVGVDPAPARPGLHMPGVLAALYALDCHYVLCEGGGGLGLSLLEDGLVDEFHLYLAPRFLGDEQAAPLFRGRAPLALRDALEMRIARLEMCGNDCHLTLKPAPDGDE